MNSDGSSTGGLGRVLDGRALANRTVRDANHGGNPNRDASGRYVLDDHGVRADGGVIADRDRAENLRPGADRDAIAKRGVTLARFG